MERLIYKATCLSNGKIYIGQTKNLEKRKKEHLRSSKKHNTNSIFHKAIEKYGFDDFKWEELYIGDLIDEVEAYFIRYYSAHYKNGNGYNMSFGAANKGFKHSEEFKTAMSKRMKGNSYAHGYNTSDDEKRRKYLDMLKRKKLERAEARKNKQKKPPIARNLTEYIFSNGAYAFTGTALAFILNHNVCKTSVYSLCRGKIKQHKGWTVQSVQNTF